jgi:hypothetical protein
VSAGVAEGKEVDVVVGVAAVRYSPLVVTVVVTNIAGTVTVTYTVLPSAEGLPDTFSSSFKIDLENGVEVAKGDAILSLSKGISDINSRRTFYALSTCISGYMSCEC